MNDNNEVRWPYRQLVDDVVDWCRTELHCAKWNQLIKEASDSFGFWAQGLWWWWWWASNSSHHIGCCSGCCKWLPLAAVCGWVLS